MMIWNDTLLKDHCLWTTSSWPAQADTDISSYTVWCCYKVVNFLKNIHKRHPISHPLGQGMGCLFVGSASD